MSDNNSKEALYNDLIADWHVQKSLIKEQIKLIDPMATSLRKSIAQRFLNESLNIIMEILMYLLSISSIACLFFINNIGPFYLIDKIATDPEIVTAKIRLEEINNFKYAVYSLFILLAILFFAIGRMLSNIRRKNATLSFAGKNMKIVSGQLLSRKSAIDILEHNHVMVLPKTDIEIDSISSIPKSEANHDDILL